VLGFVLLLGEFGALLNLPQWVVDVSPYAHSPRISDLTVTPVAWLTLLAVGLLAAGAHGFRRRDVA
jgi:ABC-2 type transport system permease protein